MKDYLSLKWSHTTQGHFTHDIESPWPLHFKHEHSHWWKGRSRSKFASHYAWGTNGVCMWMQDGCKVYMDSYMPSNGSCSLVTWTIIKNHLLEISLTQNRETMALWNLTTVDLFYFYHARGPALMKINWNGIWLRTWSHMTSHYAWGTVTTLHDFGDVLGRSLDTFFWALTISWSRLSARVWSGPNAPFFPLDISK